MTNDELMAAAADRLKNARSGDGYFWRYGSIGTQYLDDLRVLAKAYLSTVQADDGELMDEVWLAANPQVFKIAGYETAIQAICGSFYLCQTNQRDEFLEDVDEFDREGRDNVLLPSAITRGQVRKLVESLGGR